jgi:fibronectin type 3 domain-containing protein
VFLLIGLSANAFAQNPSCPNGGAHCTILTWTASVTPGIIGYNVYRSTTSGTEGGTPLNGATPVAATTYEDDAVTAGRVYYYVVTAIAANGVTESAFSNEAQDQIPGATAPASTMLAEVKR